MSKLKRLFAAKPASTQTLQELQGKFNQTIFQIGAATLQANKFREEAKKADADAVKFMKEAQAIDDEAAVIRGRIKAEVDAKAAEGAPK